MDPDRMTPARRSKIAGRGRAAIALSVLLLAAGPAWAAVRSGAPDSTPPPAPEPAEVVHYRFDRAEAGGMLADSTGHGHTLVARTRNGAELRSIDRDAGQAVQFPKACAARRCPRLALETASSPDLNPGNRPIRFGATVILPARQTSDGENILQKGYSASGGQYKLQADKRPGHPSCALTAGGSPEIHLAKSSVSIADGAWHALECRRAGTTLSILVDGVIRGAATVPADLTVRNDAPLVLGGKGLSNNSDPFQGALDDVWVSIG